ncbi:MAG: trypsin-like peptidase domain-containing protein [Oscillospiraceae bacterium]
MDTFDHIQFDDTPEENLNQQEEPVAQEPDSGAYHNHGTGRKESPYADSPYEMHHSPRQEYHYRPQTQPPVKPKKEKKPRKGIWKGILAGVLAIVLVAGSCLATAAYMEDAYNDVMEDTIERYNEKIDSMQKQIDGLNTGRGGVSVPSDGSAMTPAQLYASQVNSVVAISTTIQSGRASGQSSGSGFILTEDGYVITNYHVVEGATEIQVITHDGTEYDAQLVGKDATNDLAVLKVEATGLPAATLGSSNDLVIGDMVVAIGNPLGELASTQTVGYVSGIDREVSTSGSITTISMIQTDAAINPGNSGGPLFNMYGEVIGITTAKYSGTTGSGATIEGIGFAIPIDDVEPLINDLIDYGYVTGAYMAVTVQDTDESAEKFGLPSGAYIVSVEKDGAAERAGIQPKDIVIAVDEHKVSNVTELTRALRNYKAGDTATIKLIRSGAEMTVEITFDERPQQTEEPASAQDPSQPNEGSYDEWFDYFRRYFGG